MKSHKDDIFEEAEQLLAEGALDSDFSQTGCKWHCGILDCCLAKSLLAKGDAVTDTVINHFLTKP